MELRQRAVRGVIWSAAQTWGGRAISFLVMIILARLVLPQAFGLVAYANVFIAFAQIFVDQGFSEAIVQFPQLDREHLDTAFWVSALTGTFLTVASIASSGVIANLFREPQLAPIVRWLSPVFVLSALSSVQQSILRRQIAFRRLTVRSLAANLSGCAVAVIMAFLGCGVWSLVAKIVVTGLVNVVALWQVSDWRPSFRFSTRHFKELFSFGINIVGGNFVNFFSEHSGDFLIGYFLGPIALGYYILAYNLLTVMTDLLVTVPNAVAFPVFSSIQSDPARMKQAFYEVTQLQSIIAFPVFLGMSAVSSEMVRILYGSEWASSIPVIQILMLIGIVRSASNFYNSVFKAAGKPSWRFGIWTLTAVLNVVGFLFTVRMGIVAVAASYVVVSYILMPLYFLLVRSLIRIAVRPHLDQYIPAMLGSLAMIASVFALKLFLGQKVILPLYLSILVLAGGASYLLTLRLMRPLLYQKMLELGQLALPKFPLGNLKV